MDTQSLAAGGVAAIAVALIGGVGRLLGLWYSGRSKRRQITTQKELSATEQASLTAHELLRYSYEKAREYANDLEQQVDRLQANEQRLEATIERLRGERDAAREDALGERLRARECEQALAREREERDP